MVVKRDILWLGHPPPDADDCFEDYNLHDHVRYSIQYWNYDVEVTFMATWIILPHFMPHQYHIDNMRIPETDC